MTYTAPAAIGKTHEKISDAKKSAQRFDYGREAIGDDRSDTYTEGFGEFLKEFRQRVNDGVDAGRRKGPLITVPNAETGLVPFDWTVQDQLGLKAASSPEPVREFRNIWFYSAPGSGASWWVGPSFQVGKWCWDVLGINHQPLGFPMGGYLGALGGDPGLSYNEVIEAEGAELERQLDINPHVQEALRRVNDGLSTDIEFWFSGYSQSADGMEDALVRLFGDGGKYAKLRSRINGVIQFGNPSKDKTGIARKKRPQWLLDLVRNITAKGDFYAEATDSIRPLFYAEVVRAETSLSFAGHILKIAVPVIFNFLGPLLGQGAITALGSLVQGALADANNREHEKVDDDLIALLSAKGIITNLGELLKLVASLGGLQAHAEYEWPPKPEFGNRTGVDVGREIVASFRR